MKYNFVFDKDFLGNKTFCLSESGYHTERLVSAIKYLRDKNAPFVSVESTIEYDELKGYDFRTVN